MTPDEGQGRAEAITGPCSCHEGYSSRKLIDPACAWHSFADDITAALRAERVKALEEAAKVVERECSTHKGLFVSKYVAELMEKSMAQAIREQARRAGAAQ